MTTINIKQIAVELDLFNKILDWHYDVEQTALETGDIGSDESVEYVAELIAEQHDELSYDDCEKLANQFFDDYADDIIAEICDRDRDAIEYADDVREEMRGEY